MQQQGYATGTDGGPGGAADGRAGGAGHPTADAWDGAPVRRLSERLAGSDPATAHRVFTAAFGLHGARHFKGHPVAAAPGTSWWHGPSAYRSLPLRALAERPAARRARRAVPPQDTAAAPVKAGRHRRPERRAASAPEAALERRTAARLLLAHPLVTADGPHGAGFALIRRHADWLTERFREVLGYPLTVGDGHARLHKTALPDRGLPGFTPARYARLVLALEEAADGRLPRLDDDPGIAEVLTGWQVLGAGGGTDRRLARALTPLPAPPEPEPGVVLRRLLAETPVVLFDELPAAEREAALAGPAQTELVAEFLGLEAELRAEGVALLDPAGELTDLALPATGAAGQAALLLVGLLVEELRPLPDEPVPPGVLVPDALIDGALGDVTDEYGLRAGWPLEQLADRPAFRREVTGLLHRMSLLAPAGRGWVLRAPAARFAPQAELHPPPGTGRHSRPAPAVS